VQFKAGNSVPLVLQLFDGAANYHPLARVLGPTGDEIAEVELEHKVSGLYAGTVQMPSVPFVAVQYFVYQDEDRTQLASSYSLAAEVIQRATPEVSSSMTDLVGQIDEISLDGSITDLELIGTVKES